MHTSPILPTLFLTLTLAFVVPVTAQADVLINDPASSIGKPALASGPNGVLYAVAEDLVLQWFYVYESTDGGESWTYLTGVVGGPSGYETANPSIAVGEDYNDQQRVFVAYEATQPDNSKSVEVYQFDPDNTFDSDITTIESGLDMDDEIHPEICTDSSIYVGDFGVYLVYNSQGGIDPGHHVMFSRSTDQGTSWSTPHTIATSAYETRQRPHIAFGGPIGFPGDSYRLFVAYESASYIGGNWLNNVFMRVSRNFGVNWDAPVQLTSATDDQYDARVAATAGNTTVEVVYTSNYLNSGDLDIHYAYSTNAGVNWTTNRWLATSNDVEQSPDIAITGTNRFHCAYWMSNDVLYTWTDDTAPTGWAAPDTVNQGQTVSGTHTQPSVAALQGGNEAHEGSIAWTDTRGASFDAYFNRAQWPPVYIVLPDGNGHFPTIQDAIDNAMAGSLVLLGDGVFAGPGNRDIDFNGKSLTVRSESGDPETCVIDCEGSPDDPHFGFIFASQEGRDTRLESVTITNGYMTIDDAESEVLAGGITIRQASPAIGNVRLINNHSVVSDIPLPLPLPALPPGQALAGGMACYGPDSQGVSPLLEGCFFADNSISMDLAVSPAVEIEQIAAAGGLALFGCAPDIRTEPTFVGNTASFSEILDYNGDFAAGGGIAGAQATLDLVGGIVTGNTVTAEAGRGVAEANVSLAGGIACLASSVAADNCEVTENQVHSNPIPLPYPASPMAGGMSVLGSSYQLVGCTFNLNRCDGSGAAAMGDSLFVAGAAGLVRSAGSVGSCVFLGNSCELEDPGNTFGYVEAAGAIIKWGGNFEMFDCEITQNVASLVGEATQVLGSGGCMFTIDGSTVVDCTLTENRVTVAGALGDVVAGGGAGCSELSQPTLNRCQFIGNEAHVDTTEAGTYPLFAVVGGGVASPADGLVLDGCIFEGNLGAVHVPAEVSLAGGTALIDAAPTIVGCLYVGNEALKNIYCSDSCAIAGALACRNSAPDVIGCTFSGNWGDRLGPGDCGSVACTDGSFPLIENSILAFGALGVPVHCDETSSASVACSNIFGNAGGDWVGCIVDQATMNGNLSENPLFCDLAAGDLTLAADSPCLPENNNECMVKIGAQGQGCDFAVAAEPVPPRSVTRLFDSRPNPFNPRTTILFDVALNQQVRLTIHDLAGRRIAILADGVLSAGRHEVIWEGRDQYGRPVASGVYLVRLETTNVSDSKKLILLK